MKTILFAVGGRPRRAVAPTGARVRGGALPADRAPSVPDSAPVRIPMV